jgi:drug/metabolite transporter (DMT)-like permease
MLAGTLCALGAGLLWGLVFVAPLWLPDYPAALLSAGRYLAFGLIALPLAWLDRRALAQFTRTDWLHALELAAIGNLLYYFLLAGAIQTAGAPLPTMIIGTLPVVIALISNRRDAARDGRLPWLRLLPSLLLIAAGIVLVHGVELAAARAGDERAEHRLWLGAALAVGALVCWTWYPIRNADWMRAHPERSARAWATAQGVVTLPLAAAAFVAALAWEAARGSGYAAPLGPRPGLYVLVMLAIGLLASWLGTLLWNAAARRLPTTLAGQLIVFETLAALTYAYLLRGAWPEPATALGIALLVAGVLWGLRAFR